MNEMILSVWIRLKEMPLFLRFLVIISPVGIIITLGFLIPFGTYGINGRTVSYAEFWRSGEGFIAIVGGSLIAAIGIGIFKRRKWANQLILALLVMQDVLALATIGKTQKGEIVGGLISLALLNALTVWYFCFKKSVKSYFEPQRDVQQAGGAAKPHTL